MSGLSDSPRLIVQGSRPLAAELEAILGGMSEGVLLVRRDGSIAGMNAAAVEFWRWTGDAPANVTDLWPVEVAHADGGPLPMEERPSRRAARGESFSNLELRLRRLDTGEIWFGSFNGRPVCEATGGHLGVLTFHDITQRLKSEIALRESERRFRRLIENNAVGVALADLNGGVHYANAAALEMLGYAAEDVASGTINWLAITPPGFAADDARAIDELRRTGACQPFEKAFLSKGGAPVPVLVSGCLLEAESAEPLMAAFLIDLRARKRMEERLRQAQKAESVGLLAAGVAHDFNNLLLGIMGHASLALEALPEASPVGPSLEAIVQSARQAAHLTRQMLAYAGKGRFIVEQLDISALGREAFSAVASSLSSKLTCHISFADQLPPVEGDRTQLQQAFANLLINASEALGEKEGIVSIRTGARTLDEEAARRLSGWGIAAGPCVFLAVADSGCGMDGETLSRIFDPFYTTKFTGRGLGLAALAGIVRAHRGAVEVDSSPGKGSRFTLWLPASQAAAQPETKTKPARVRGSGSVLIVEDDDTARGVAKTALELRGFTALPAAGGVEALRIASGDAEISAVVLDMEMPGMSGAETLVALRDKMPGIPVLVVSGYSEEEMRRVFASGGVSAFLAKPYTPDQLAAAVKQVVDS